MDKYLSWEVIIDVSKYIDTHIAAAVLTSIFKNTIGFYYLTIQLCMLAHTHDSLY